MLRSGSDGFPIFILGLWLLPAEEMLAREIQERLRLVEALDMDDDYDYDDDIEDDDDDDDDYDDDDYDDDDEEQQELTEEIQGLTNRIEEIQVAIRSGGALTVSSQD